MLQLERALLVDGRGNGGLHQGQVLGRNVVVRPVGGRVQGVGQKILADELLHVGPVGAHPVHRVGSSRHEQAELLFGPAQGFFGAGLRHGGPGALGGFLQQVRFQGGPGPRGGLGEAQETDQLAVAHDRHVNGGPNVGGAADLPDEVVQQGRGFHVGRHHGLAFPQRRIEQGHVAERIFPQHGGQAGLGRVVPNGYRVAGHFGVVAAVGREVVQGHVRHGGLHRRGIVHGPQRVAQGQQVGLPGLALPQHLLGPAACRHVAEQHRQAARLRLRHRLRLKPQVAPGHVFLKPPGLAAGRRLVVDGHDVGFEAGHQLPNRAAGRVGQAGVPLKRRVHHQVAVVAGLARPGGHFFEQAKALLHVGEQGAVAGLGLAQGFLGPLALGDVGEKNGHVPGLGLGRADGKGIHVEPAPQRRALRLEARGLAGAGHPAVGIEPVLLVGGGQLAHGAAQHFAQAGLLLKRRIDIQKAVIDGVPGLVEQHFDDAEALVHRVIQRQVVVGGVPGQLVLHAQQLLGGLLALGHVLQQAQQPGGLAQRVALHPAVALQGAQLPVGAVDAALVVVGLPVLGGLGQHLPHRRRVVGLGAGIDERQVGLERAGLLAKQPVHAVGEVEAPGGQLQLVAAGAGHRLGAPQQRVGGGLPEVVLAVALLLRRNVLPVHHPVVALAGPGMGNPLLVPGQEKLAGGRARLARDLLQGVQQVGGQGAGGGGPQRPALHVGGPHAPPVGGLLVQVPHGAVRVEHHHAPGQAVQQRARVGCQAGGRASERRSGSTRWRRTKSVRFAHARR